MADKSTTTNVNCHSSQYTSNIYIKHTIYHIHVLLLQFLFPLLLWKVHIIVTQYYYLGNIVVTSSIKM